MHCNNAHGSFRGLSDHPLVDPKAVESVSGKFGISGGMGDLPVAEIVLNSAGIVALIGQIEPRGMPQHMRMNRER